MKRLDLNPAPRAVEIDAELTLQVRPLSPFDLVALLEDLGIAPTQDALEALRETLTVARLLDLVGRLAELAVADWTVCDETGARLPVSAEAARALIKAEPELAGPFLEKILAPAVEAATTLAAEGNGSRPSPNGRSAGAEDTAPPASPAALTAPRS